MFKVSVLITDRKMGAKNNKVMLFTNQCASHSKKAFLWDTNICFHQLTAPASYSLKMQESSVHSSIIIENTSFNRLLLRQIV
jgi:hypothetical protein